MDYVIRVAKESDAQAVHDIYGAYVPGLNVTFTINNPSVEEYREKIKKTMVHYPFYVAESSDGKILGYVYGSTLRPHDAYKWNVESTIVLAPDAPRRQGIATALYNKFFEELKRLNYLYVYAVIVDTNKESLAFHTALGFEQVGHFVNAGYKKGSWLGIVWMNKFVGDKNSEIKEPVGFCAE